MSTNRKMRRGRLAIVAASVPLCSSPAAAFLSPRSPIQGARRALALEAKRKKKKNKLQLRRRGAVLDPPSAILDSDDRHARRGLFRGISRSIEREYRKEEADAMITLSEALQETRTSDDPLGYLKSYAQKAKARVPGDTETKYSLLNVRSYANTEVLDRKNLDSPPKLSDLNQKAIDPKEAYWVKPPFRLFVFFGAYNIFPYITDLSKVVVTTDSEDFSLVAGQFGPGVGVLYGTIVALTLDILYERQSRVQENVTLEAGLLSQITQHILALFDGDDEEQYELAKNSCQLVADQVKTLVGRTRGAELLAIMKADPYSQLLSIIDDFHRERDTTLSLQEQSVVASLREDIPQIMEARAKRLSDEASALPPTHFLVLSLLTGLIMVGYVVSTLTIIDESGKPPQEASLVFAALTAVYVLFYNFCKDLNGPFQGVYQIRRSSAASYLLQIKWLISNQSFTEEIVYDDVATGVAAEEEESSPELSFSSVDAAQSVFDKVKKAFGVSDTHESDSKTETESFQRVNGAVVDGNIFTKEHSVHGSLVESNDSTSPLQSPKIDSTANGESELDKSDAKELDIASSQAIEGEGDGSLVESNDSTSPLRSPKIDSTANGANELDKSDAQELDIASSHAIEGGVVFPETRGDVGSIQGHVAGSSAKVSQVTARAEDAVAIATSRLDEVSMESIHTQKEEISAAPRGVEIPNVSVAEDVEPSGSDEPYHLSEHARYFLSISGFQALTMEKAKDAILSTQEREEGTRRLLAEKKAKQDEKWKTYYGAKLKPNDTTLREETPSRSDTSKTSVNTGWEKANARKAAGSRAKDEAKVATLSAQARQEVARQLQEKKNDVQDAKWKSYYDAKIKPKDPELTAEKQPRAETTEKYMSAVAKKNEYVDVADSKATDEKAGVSIKEKAKLEANKVQEVAIREAEEEKAEAAEAEARAAAEAEAAAAAEVERKKLEEEKAARLAAEEEAKRVAEEEATARAEARAAAEAETQRKREEETVAAARRAAEEEEAVARRAAVEAEARRRAEEDASLRPLKDRATGIEFAPKLDDMYLLGVGVRKKAIINVYSVGAYSSYEAKRSLSSLSAKSDRKAALSALRSAAKTAPTTSFLLQMAFKAGADAMASAIAESVAPRHSGDRAEVDQLRMLIFDGVQAKGAATKGTTFLFECEAGSLTVSVDGELQGMVISDSLGGAFCDVFMDDKAVSPPLKDSCLQNCCSS